MSAASQSALKKAAARLAPLPLLLVVDSMRPSPRLQWPVFVKRPEMQERATNVAECVTPGSVIAREGELGVFALSLDTPAPYQPQSP
jgi:hypothetical protein